MVQSLRNLDQAPAHHAAAHPAAEPFRVVSWNLLRRVGAGAADVAALIRQARPDLLLLQEATQEVEALPDLVGGHFFRHPMQKRIYGLAAWSPYAISRPTAMRLPVSALPGRVPPRDALLVQFRGVSFANVHLSHGQFLNRWQILHVIRQLKGPAAIIGDFNAVGPTVLPGFRDIGPRQPTLSHGNLISLRLDRCLANGLECGFSQVLERGPSDHHPILLELSLAGRARKSRAS